jgi:hypothetical protein
MIVQILDSLTNVFEILANELLGELAKTELDFLVESAVVCILEDHVSDVFLLFVIIIEQLDDVGMVQFMVDVDFLFCVFAMNLNGHEWLTSLIATI